MSKDFPNIHLKPYEALFKSSGSSNNREIPVDEIDEFPNHPFNVNDDEDMEKWLKVSEKMVRLHQLFFVK